MLKKYIKIEFCGHSPERFINLCRQKQIAIWSLESDTIKYSCCIYAKDFKKLKAFARKSKVKIKIVEKHGLSFVLFRYRKRKWFLLGIMLAFCMMFSLSRFIWNIEIEGNQGISDDVIYDYLKEKRIYSGMKKSKVDCDKICKELRLDFHKIIWVSASLNGTSLKLDIREGKELSGSSANMEEGHDIISQANGTISSIVTRSGVPNVKKGDTVIKGQVLVSGVIEIKNDAGELIREEKTCADADIWIKTELAYEDTCDKTVKT